MSNDASSWQKRYEEKRKAYEAKRAKEKAHALEVYESSTPEKIRAEYFKDYGCINFKGSEFMKTLQLARDLHDIDKQKFPELHDEHEREPYRCYHVTECKCGFSEACDSSD